MSARDQYIDQLGTHFTYYKGAVFIHQTDEYLAVAVQSPLYMGGVFVVLDILERGKERGAYFLKHTSTDSLNTAVQKVLSSAGGNEFARVMLRKKDSHYQGKEAVGEQVLKRIASSFGTWYTHYRGTIWVSEQNPAVGVQGAMVAIRSERLNGGALTKLGHCDRGGDRMHYTVDRVTYTTLDEIVESFIAPFIKQKGMRGKVVGYPKGKEG